MDDATESLDRPERSPGRSGRRQRWPRYAEAELGLTGYWYPAVRSRQLRLKKPVGLKLLGQEIVLIRADGKVHALEGRCAHRGLPLSEGRFEFPCTISCAYHGWTYDLSSGRLVAALSDGPDSSLVGKVQLRTFPTTERKGFVWVFVGEGDPPPLEDEVPAEFLDATNLAFGRVKEFTGNWRLAIEGAIDPGHAFYLHRTALLVSPYNFPAARGRFWPKTVDDRYLTYTTDPPVPEAEYPGLGSWPRSRWWKRRRLTKLDAIAFLPCGFYITPVKFNAPFLKVFSFYVPVDDSNYRWFQFLVTDVRGVRRLWARVKYYLWLRWAYQILFLNQDARMNELIHPFYAEQGGWERERLYRPDVVITAWRKFANERARGIAG